MSNNIKLWEILVPTLMGGSEKPIRTKYHRVWDKYVRSLSGGLTILRPAIGQWVDKDDGKLYQERMIPVRIACTEDDINKIVDFTIKYYKQIAVMCYKISDEVTIKRKNG